MASENLDKVKTLARDLGSEKPRSPLEELGGFEIAARTLDKCRATLAGTPGEYQFNCPMDQKFFAQTGSRRRSSASSSRRGRRTKRWASGSANMHSPAARTSYSALHALGKSATPPMPA
jgi:hypothetical protein